MSSEFATKAQIRRLYSLLYQRRLDRYEVKYAVENICRYLKVWTIGDITKKEIEEAYELIKYINDMGEIDEVKLVKDKNKK